MAFYRRMTKAFSEQTTLFIYAALIGIGGAYGAVGFRWLIRKFTFLFFHHTQNQLATYHGFLNPDCSDNWRIVGGHANPIHSQGNERKRRF